MASRPKRRLPLGRRSGRRLGYERRLRVLLWSLSLPLLALAVALLRQFHASPLVWAAALGFAALGWSLVQATVTEQLLRPLQTLSNVVAALRENDFSFRARGARRGDALGDLALEINALANDLQRERVAAIESSALMRRVLAALEAPVLAFDQQGVLRLLNRAAANLLRVRSPEAALGRHADALGIGHLLLARDEQVIRFGAAQWMLRRSGFREGGVPHTLLLLSDVSAALRQEERQAWQRLIRVMGHEINNSLTPIKSIAGSLRTLARQGAPIEEFARPLEIIEDRAASLNRFLTAYRQLAQLPPPRREPLELGSLLEQLSALETRVPVSLHPGPVRTLLADRDQMGQAVINLLRNAAEAALENREAPACVELRWFEEAPHAVICLRDSGLGIANPANLFVPFYTTKPGGAGIGLALVKQIAEAHGGAAALRTHPEGGAEAELRIPLP